MNESLKVLSIAIILTSIGAILVAIAQIMNTLRIRDLERRINELDSEREP